jgi:hypothetical protein
MTKEGGKDARKVVNPTSHGSGRKVRIPRKKRTDLVASTTTTQIQEEINSAEDWKKRFRGRRTEERRIGERAR